MTGPVVTVVIATYDWATVLPYSIGSVLDQTFTDFELLVIGDGCTDESEAVVSEIDDPRVHWINLPANTGHQSGPNNEGLRRARGAIVAWLGHDDLWLPHHLETLVPVVAAGRAAVHGHWLDVDPVAGTRVLPPEGWRYTNGAWIPPTATVQSHAAVVATGGWRPPAETGHLDPEADLLSRIRSTSGPPVAVPAVTCIKFPAAVRRDVYRTRPHHEQAHWLATIRRADDPEAVVRAAAPTVHPASAVPPRFLPARRLAWRLTRRFRRSSAAPATQPDPGPAPPPETALDRYLRNRRFKGL